MPISQLVPKQKKEESRPKPEKKAPSSKKAQSGGLREAAFYETKRGALIQALLRRWWYAIEWPDPSVADVKPLENFEPMPSFPGVHLCTSGPRLGEIIDYRDHSTSPCFKNLYTKPSAELKELLLTAYKKQIQVLVEAEGECQYATMLRQELALASRVNTQKADAEAVKAVAAYDNFYR